MNANGMIRPRPALGFCIAFAVLLGLIGFLLFANLGSMFITDYDEARHGVNAYEMIRSGDYILSTYQGAPDLWNLKPPLSFWLIATGYRLFGYNAFALRFFSALAALLSAAVIGLWAARRMGRMASLVALLAIAANATVYGLHFARFGDADSQYQLFFTLAMLCLLLSDGDFRWLYGSGLFFGLAFLEKGTHAFTIPAVCLLTLCCAGRLRQLTLKRILLLLLSGAAFIAPWAILRYLRDGLTFFQAMISTDVVNRAGSTADILGEGVSAPLYYLREIGNNPTLVICLALCALSLLVLLVTRTRLTPAQKHAAIGAALWFLLPIALYCIANAKYRWYIYSSLYAVPVLAGVLLTAAVRAQGWRKPLVASLTVAALCFSVFATQNAIKVMNPETHHAVQEFLRDQLDRDADSQVHAYIQYNENQQTTWMQASMLTALMYGDVVCMDGGVEAFLNDEESAILFIAKEANQEEIDQLLEMEPVRGENYYLIAFDKI